MNAQQIPTTVMLLLHVQTQSVLLTVHVRRAMLVMASLVVVSS